MTIHKTLSDRRIQAKLALDPTTGKFGSPAPRELATWEGSVLPALQAAAASWPELQGALLERVPSKYGIMAQITVPDRAVVAMEIDTRTAAGVVKGCRDLAHVTAYRVSTVVPPTRPACEVCEAIAGWAPMCSACDVASKEAPPATTETKSPPCAGYALPSMPPGRLATHVGPASTLVDWRKLLVNQHVVSRADGLNDPCAPPEGFAFKKVSEGIAVFRTQGGCMPNRLGTSYYWDAATDAKQRERHPDFSNDAPGRWTGCEEARDWAAWALGETP